MIGHILATLLPVFLITGCGAAYGRYRRPDIRSLNTLNMELFVPLLVFAVLADRQAPLAEYAWLATAAVAVVLGSGVVLWPVAKWLKLDIKTFLPPMMFNNSGNMGVPLLVLAFGPDALPAAVVVFIVEMLLHFSVGLYMLNPHAYRVGELGGAGGEHQWTAATKLAAGGYAYAGRSMYPLNAVCARGAAAGN